jgi:aryl-alcohol dehydrogenase (NADP+)
VLSGKYLPNVAPAQGTRADRKDARMMQTEWRHESLELAQRVKAHAEARGTTPVAFAIAWVLNNAFVTSAIAGPRTLEQWRSYRSALDYRLDAADEAFIDSLVTPGHPSTPGYNDPAYPLEGRVPRTR